MTGRSIQSQVAEIQGSLPESHRKVADLLRRDPEAVAFGTLASVASAAGTSTPTVVRFAGRLGYGGFGALREAVRSEVSAQIRSAADRVGRPAEGPLLARALDVERANLERTYASFDGDVLPRVTELLTDLDRRVWVLPSSQTAGIGSNLADDLQICRPRVTLLEGSEFRIMTVLSSLRVGDVILTIDVQRHERWLTRVQHHAVARGAVPLALTDRLPCSLDLTGGLGIVCGCETTSPFESQVGMVAAGNILVSAVAEALRDSLATRVDALEATWVDNDLFDS